MVSIYHPATEQDAQFMKKYGVVVNELPILGITILCQSTSWEEEWYASTIGEKLIFSKRPPTEPEEMKGMMREGVSQENLETLVSNLLQVYNRTTTQEAPKLQIVIVSLEQEGRIKKQEDGTYHVAEYLYYVVTEMNLLEKE
jgi:hypothetical protein